MAEYRVTVGGELYRFGEHVVMRYQERVKPAFDLLQVRAELARVLPLAKLSHRPPVWKANPTDPPDGWLMLGDGVAFPIQKGVLVSCLTPQEMGEDLRVARRREKRRARAEARGARGARKKHGKVARNARYRSRALREEAGDG